MVVTVGRTQKILTTHAMCGLVAYRYRYRYWSMSRVIVGALTRVSESSLVRLCRYDSRILVTVASTVFPKCVLHDITPKKQDKV